VTGLEQELLRRGYHLEPVGKQQLAFSPKLWQQDKAARLRSAAEALRHHIKPDGYLEWQADPGLRDFASGILAEVSVSLAEDTPVAVCSQYSYNLSRGEQSLKVDGGIGFPPSHRNRSSGSTPPVYKAEPVSSRYKASDFRVEWPDVYIVRGYGGLDHGEDRTIAFQRAVDLLSRHLRDEQKLQQSVNEEIGKARNGFLASACTGKGFGDLPADMQKDLINAFSTRFAELGFKSEDEAMEFLKGATVDGASQKAYLSVTVQHAAGDRFGITVQIP
jgi:hypothetical protein